MNGPANSNGGARDKTFVRTILVLSSVAVLFGFASLVLAIASDPSDAVILRIIGAFGAMFSGIVGLVVGYISGRH